MQQADILLTGGVVITMDDAFHQYPNGAVAIRGDSIVAVGDADQIAAGYTATEVIDCTGCCIMPGLINCHTHTPMTLLRGLADDLRLDVWLYGYMLPVERRFVSPEFVALGTRLACAEMIRSGVTCVNDMYYFEETIAQTIAEVGLRALCSQTIMQFPTPDASSADESLEFTEAFIRKWKGHPLITPVIAPHAPYTCSGPLMRTCAEIAIQYDVPLHIHISETFQEVEDSRREHGMPVVNWVKKNGVLEAKVIAAHCVAIDAGEMRTLRNAGATVAHNPSANLKLASGIANVTQMLKTGLNVGIGTDGPASNNDLDHFEEMRLAALLAKGSTRDPVAVPARMAMLMATRMGAHALHIGHITGSLEAGKRADVIVLELRRLHSTPQYSRIAAGSDAIYTQIVYSSKASDVRDVFVNGKPLMRDRALLTLDEAAIEAEANRLAQQIHTFLIAREGDVLRKLAAIGGVQQEESFEVQVKARIGDPQPIIEIINSGEINVVRHVHYRQYDTYFFFEDEPSRLRYREDERVDEKGNVVGSRYRLTLVSGQSEREYPHSILLSRVRFMSPADRSLRFYREYFKPAREVQVEKDRLRWEVFYDDEELFINIDRMVNPAHDGYFLEIKSRTWSKRDAERKAAVIGKLLVRFGVSDDAVLRQEYVQIAQG
ncbi:MAG: amidohydrolase [Candidatus Thermofonsia Clade 3 bacterium]|jgi:5-methylthioadenosine/S-adenosylhomocysteine deaminase|uniref:5-methylthioadenosine/S-adenosylhomocysteine deaminase n=1 Tax=Candidatus Thermofonsia Clade 3 bacterium TaxID=2364212 RepID=A0A2M8QEU5_9CHLR|nr:amidohydrolase family protein [Candidatus Roseilinea sp. NK_OTU-006]PJF48327.1 MAG: amidohydrolase [Candidatus Thermofonsia Clade 3 bacterium]